MKKQHKKVRNPIAVAMAARYGVTQTTHRDRRDRRLGDARRSWKREDYSDKSFQQRTLCKFSSKKDKIGS